MAVFKRQNISGVTASQKPKIGPLLGGQLAKRSRVSAVMRSQDKVAALGRRVVASQSLSAESTWLVPSTDPDSATRTHPNAGEARVVHRVRCNVTPGCFFRLSVLYIPAGATQVVITPSNLDPAGAGGSVRVNVTWYDRAASSVSTEHDVAMAPSNGTFNGEPAAPWGSVRLVGVALIAPPDISDADDLATWTEHIHAIVTVSHIGGARVIDAVLEEIPHGVSREVDDAGDLWTSHVFAEGSADGNAPPLGHPMQRFSETTPDGDPRGGSWHLMDVANAQRLRLGPQLITWTSWTESLAGVTETTIPSSFTSSSSFVRVVDGVAGAYDEDGPGWSISGYARGYAENHPFWSENNGSIPVLVAVYGATSGGGGGIVRIQASDSSWVEVVIDSSSLGWFLGYGHLRCGVGPGDPSTVQALFRATSGQVFVRAMTVFHMGNTAPATL